MRVLITGSTGLGAVVADAFSGHELTVIGRNDCTEGGALEADIVIHTAGGGLGLKQPLLHSAEIRALFHLNLGLQMEVNRRVIPRMIERKSGYICHVCSIASFEAVGSVGYNTVKAALAAYVRSLGREMAPHGLVITGVAPGGFRCPGNAMDRLAHANPQVYDEFIAQRLPRGFMGDAQELVPLIQFLTSPAASMMAGTVVQIDAGEGKAYAGN